MAAKKKAKKPLAKKAMRKTKGGSGRYLLELQYVKGEATSTPLPMEQLSLNYSKMIQE